MSKKERAKLKLEKRATRGPGFSSYPSYKLTKLKELKEKEESDKKQPEVQKFANPAASDGYALDDPTSQS